MIRDERRPEDAPPADIFLTCVDCRTPFLWDVGEQQFFAARGFVEPRRCRPCREARRERFETSPDRP